MRYAEEEFQISHSRHKMLILFGSQQTSSEQLPIITMLFQ